MTATVPTGHQPAWWERRVVPYVTSWSSEEDISAQDLFISQHGLYYTEEDPQDRDKHRVLWRRTAGGYGLGSPRWRALHPQRQRHPARRQRERCALTPLPSRPSNGT
ncbi:hypothetical protein ACF1DY_31865 [Streptomyces albus]|uniref:hypothetical protein n=1 Tax=Streptomyces albus TaxID=1888 RepID=UPI0037006B61